MSKIYLISFIEIKFLSSKFDFLFRIYDHTSSRFKFYFKFQDNKKIKSFDKLNCTITYTYELAIRMSFTTPDSFLTDEI